MSLDHGAPTCEECGIEDASEFYVVSLDPDATRDDGPPRYTTRPWLCDAHAAELAEDDLVLYIGRP